MRQRLIVLAIGGLAVAAGIGAAVFAGQQGWFGGKAARLFKQAEGAQQRGRLGEAQQRLEELVTTFPDAPVADDALLKLGEVYEAQQQLVEARRMYQTLLDRFPGSPLAADTQARLGGVNIALLFSPRASDLDEAHVVKAGETLGKIAAANGTTVEFLRKANSLKSDVIQPGQKLKTPKGRFSIVVNKSHNELLLTEENRFIRSYPVATGKDNSTPAGTFKIITKVPNPVWYKQGAVVPSGSPENILGARWMGIDKQGYGIHGSVDPGAIGRQVTAGCVRMTNKDVEELFALVPIGTDVTIVD